MNLNPTAAKYPTFVRGTDFYKRFALLALPIILQNVITQAVSLADNVMVSGLGEIVLDGVYCVNIVTTFVGQVVHGIAPAMTVLATQYWGRGKDSDSENVKKIISIGTRIVLACSLLIALAMFCFPSQMLSLFTRDQTVIASAISYARIMAVGYLFFCLANSLIAGMQSVEVVRIGMLVSVIALVVNVSLNWVFIYGKLGMPALGATGAALSTLISRIIEASVMVWYVCFHDKRLKMRVRDFFRKLDTALLRDFVRYGLPVFIGSVTWGINLTVQGMIVGRLDTYSIAAVSVSNTVFSILTVGAYGSATASSIVIGKTVGGGDRELVKQYARTLQLIFVIVGVFTGALIFFSRPAVLAVYSSLEPQTLYYANQFLIVLAAMSVGTSYQMSTLTGIVRAGGDTSFVLINDLIFVWCIVIPSAALSAFVFGAPSWVTVLCLKCDQILKCAVAVVKVNRWDWMKKLTR